MDEKISQFRLKSQELFSPNQLTALDMLFFMRKKALRPARDIFRENLKKIHVALDPTVKRPDNSRALARLIKVPQRTMWSALNSASDPYITLDRIAAAVPCEPWQLLYPMGDEFVVRLLRTYSSANKRGRHQFLLTVEAVEKHFLGPDLEEEPQNKGQ